MGESILQRSVSSPCKKSWRSNKSGSFTWAFRTDGVVSNVRKKGKKLKLL